MAKATMFDLDSNATGMLRGPDKPKSNLHRRSPVHVLGCMFITGEQLAAVPEGSVAGQQRQGPQLSGTFGV